MNMELTKIQVVQDLLELAERYVSAADNERLLVKGASTGSDALMHLQNAIHAGQMAMMYRNMSKYEEAIIKLFAKED